MSGALPATSTRRVTITQPLYCLTERCLSQVASSTRGMKTPARNSTIQPPARGPIPTGSIIAVNFTPQHCLQMARSWSQVAPTARTSSRAQKGTTRHWTIGSSQAALTMLATCTPQRCCLTARCWPRAALVPARFLAALSFMTPE